MLQELYLGVDYLFLPEKAGQFLKIKLLLNALGEEVFILIAGDLEGFIDGVQ